MVCWLQFSIAIFCFTVRYNKTNSEWHHRSLLKIISPQLGKCGPQPSASGHIFPNFGEIIFSSDLDVIHYLYISFLRINWPNLMQFKRSEKMKSCFMVCCAVLYRAVSSSDGRKSTKMEVEVPTNCLIINDHQSDSPCTGAHWRPLSRGPDSRPTPKSEPP